MEHPPTQDDPAGGQITLRYWAAARAATGTAEEIVTTAEPVTVAALLTGAVERHGGPGGRAADVLGTCSVLVGDRPVGRADHATYRVAPGDTMELLPPFAGG